MKIELLLSAILVVLLSACGGSNNQATTDAPGATTATTPGSGSTDVILGKWRGTDTPANCPLTEFDITRTAISQTQNGVAQQYPVLGIDLQGGKPDEITLTTGGGIQPFHIVDHDHIELHTPYNQCPYTREAS